MESCVNSLAYYCCCSLFGFGVKHMNAARHFRRYFSPKRLENIYSDKIKYRATVGMDRIAPKAFEDKLDENVQLISQKVLSGKYKFTRYREVLISKGRRKEPRVISIPTIRDKLALSAYHQFLQSSFGETVQEPLLSQPRIKNDGLCFDISDKIVVDVNIAFLVIVHGIAFADLNFLNQAHQRGTV